MSGQAVRTSSEEVVAASALAETEADEEMIEWAGGAMGNALRQIADSASTGGAGRGTKVAPAIPAADSVKKFDKDWFESTCDIRKGPIANNTLYSQGDGLGSEWVKYKKCSETPDRQFTDIKDDETCTSKCQEVAQTSPGDSFCCGFHKDDKLCSISKGWHSREDSDYGENVVWRTPKQVRFVKVPVPGSPDQTFEEADKMQKYFETLIDQVGRMSMPGIMEHMLSFYVCLRWVPDAQYMDVARFEKENVDVDDATPRSSTVSRDDLIMAYTDFDMIPLKCSSSISVRDHENIDTILSQFAGGESDLKHAYDFSKEVSSKAWRNDGSTFQRWGSRVTETDKVMREVARVEEMVDVAHRVLPWDGFIRPSAALQEKGDDSTHESKPKNLFFLCFGPRIASFPHKREAGKHVLADQNMAGCNGLWDIETMTDHLRRVKRMFSPETCLVEGLEKKLKGVFLESFMTMNVKFEEVLKGDFQNKDLDDIVRATPQEYLDKMLEESSAMEGTSMGMDSDRKVKKKYQRTARLLANAHSKWLICDTKSTVSENAFGFSEDAFRSESAYAKWLPELKKQGQLQCKVFDATTGCLKCTTGVFSHPYRCAMKDNIEWDQIWRQVKQGDHPLVTPYMRHETVKTAANESKVLFEKEDGFCLGGLKAPRTGTASQHFERIVRVEKASGDKFKAFPRPQMGLSGASKVEQCLQEHNYGSECPSPPKFSRGVLSGIVTSEESALYIDTHPGCNSQMEMDKVQQCVHDLEGSALLERHKADFGPMHVFEEFVPSGANVKEHIVQFMYVCPCSADDNSLQEEFSSFSNNDPV